MDHELTPERLARTITNDPDVINEMLYGHHVVRGNSNIDHLVWGVEHNFLEWDITDSKFQTMFYRAYNPPQGTYGMDDKMIGEIIIKTFQTGNHSQEPELIKTLINLTRKQLAVLNPDDFGEVEDGNFGPQYKGAVTPQNFQGSYPTSGMVVLKNGATFNAAIIIDAKRYPLNDEVLYLGLANTRNYSVIKSGFKVYVARSLPGLYVNPRVIKKPKYLTTVYDIYTGKRKYKHVPSMFRSMEFDCPYKIVTVLKKNITNIY